MLKSRSQYPYGEEQGGLVLDAVGGADRGIDKNMMSNYERDSSGRRSDRRPLFNGGENGGKSLELHSGLPQVYGDILTPSTPGGLDENKALIRLNQPIVELEGPPDRYNAVYIILLINGIGTLMPWNMFINADSYFREVKLKDTEFSLPFQRYLGVAAQLPNFLFCVVSLFVHVKGSLTARILSSLSVIVCVLILTAVLAMVDSSGWSTEFFAITMISVVFINCAVGVYQNSVYGLAADLPDHYSNAVVLGTNVCGTIVALMNIATMSMTPDARISAIYYFVGALFVVLVCFDSYFVLPFCKFYRFHHERAIERRTAEDERQRESHTAFSAYLQRYFRVIKEAWVQMFNIFFVFFVTLAIFPGIQVDVRPMRDDFWIPADDANGNYFRAVTCFLFFNFFAMAGSGISHWVRFPGPRFVWIPILLRGLLIPYFMYCNYCPKLRTLPVYITNDYAYIFMGIFMALSSGYFSSLIMMYAPRVVSPDKSRTTAMMATCFLILGIVCGLNSNFIIAPLVGCVNRTDITETVSAVFTTLPTTNLTL